MVYQRILPPACPRQEIDHPSSSSTPMTSSTEIDHSDHPPAIVSSESVDRHVRGDPYGTDHHPAIVSSESVARQVRGDPYGTDHHPACESVERQVRGRMRITNRFRETRIIPTYRNGCKNSERILWMIEFLNAETHTPVPLKNHL